MATTTSALVDGRGTGFVPDDPDPRDWRLAAVADAVPSESVRRRIVTAPDLSKPFGVLIAEMPPIWDQGRLGSCVAHGVDRAICHVRKRQGLPYQEPSHLFAYWVARWLRGGVEATKVDTGSSGRLCLQGTKTYGVPRKTSWPYVAANVDDRPSQPAWDAATQYQTIEYWGIADGDVAAMQACLAEGWGFVAGLDLFQNFKPNADGVIPMPTGARTGGHMMYFRRHTPKLGGAVGFDNSWGTDWGRSGRGWIPWDYLREHSHSIWTIRSVEQMALPGVPA